MLLGIVPGDLATGVIEIVDARERRRTVLVAKTTFALRAGAVAVHAPPIPLVGAGFGAQTASAVAADQPADDALYKPRADVLVTASLEPPAGLRVPRWLAGFAVARGAYVLLERRALSAARPAGTKSGAEPPPSRISVRFVRFERHPRAPAGPQRIAAPPRRRTVLGSISLHASARS